MTALEIRTELAKRYNFSLAKVKCYYCAYWGYNCGKVLNSMGESKCMKRKCDYSYSAQFCKGFKPMERRIK